MKIIGVIPARIGSKRLPKKMLARLGNSTLIERTYHNAVSMGLFDEVIVATDHSDIKKVFEKSKTIVIMTSPYHMTGTDRVGEVAKKVEGDIFINIQGDEPFIEKSSFKTMIDLVKNETVSIGTLRKSISEEKILFDYNTVKVVCDKYDRCLYFSRQAIPAHRDAPFKEWIVRSNYYQHLGIYGFKKEILLELCNLKVSSLESSEKLEQLRWMENGFTIHASIVESMSYGIDTAQDLERARKDI